MSLNEIKDLMSQFDTSSLRELSIKNGDLDIYFSKNDQAQPLPQVVETLSTTPEIIEKAFCPINPVAYPVSEVVEVVEGDLVESPLVGIAYLAPAPDKEAFVSVGQSVKKGQTLLIIEAMKVMNEVPAPCDGIVTEILVANGDMVEFGKGLVRLK